MRPLVFSIPSYDALAAQLASVADLERGAVARDVFPDGERYVRVETDVNDRDAVLVGGTVDDHATLELYDLACAIVEDGAATVTLVVPYFGYSTMERAVKRGEAVIAKTRARILSSIPRAKLGNQILMLDLHSEGIPHYFEGSIRPFHVYGKPLIESLARDLAGDRFILGSTDAGRAKWVESLANDLHVPAAFVYKRRRGPESTEVTAVSTKLSGETVVIYDDMIRTGGSLMNAARAYREAGAGTMYAIATHGVFPGDALKKIAASQLFAGLAVTDSHVRARMLAGPQLRVESCASLFVPFLRRHHD
jgi:ribose-phosphate pyrophosphokinase